MSRQTFGPLSNNHKGEEKKRWLANHDHIVHACRGKYDTTGMVEDLGGHPADGNQDMLMSGKGKFSCKEIVLIMLQKCQLPAIS